MAEENEGRRTYELGTQPYDGPNGLSTGMFVPVDKSGWSEAKKLDLGIMKGNIDTLSGNIGSINTRIDELGHGLEEVSDTIETISTSVTEVQARLESKQDKIVFGDGLEYDPATKKLDVKISEDISIDDVATVVETVEDLKNDFDTKITTNFPPSLMTISNENFGEHINWGPSNGGCLFGSLFTVDLRHEIFPYDGSNEQKLTSILTVYVKQLNTAAARCILGIYEYQPNYKKIDPDTGEVKQIGRTVALCDTGIVTLHIGMNELPIKNVNNDSTTDSIDLKTDCQYYAAIYLSYHDGKQPFQLACAAPYNVDIGKTIKPQFSLVNVNSIRASIIPGTVGYTEDLSFNDFGFLWCYANYPERSGDFDVSYEEAYNCPRFYMSIRNAVDWTPPPEPEPPAPGSSYYVLQIEWNDGNGENFTFDDYYANSSSVKGNTNVLTECFKATPEKPNYTESETNFENGNYSMWATGMRFSFTLESKPSSLGWRTLGWGSQKAFTATVYEVTDEGQTWTSIGSITGTQTTNTTYTVNCS